MDNHTPEQRRKNMKAVKNKDSEIERLLRKELWSRGLRYRKNYKKIIGKPDIVFVGKKSQFSATANSGTVMIGKTKRTKFNLVENFGYLRSNAICKEISK